MMPSCYLSFIMPYRSGCVLSDWHPPRKPGTDCTLQSALHVFFCTTVASLNSSKKEKKGGVLYASNGNNCSPCFRFRNSGFQRDPFSAGDSLRFSSIRRANMVLSATNTNHTSTCAERSIPGSVSKFFIIITCTPSCSFIIVRTMLSRSDRGLL
jgi:hypothetical protein